jgi:tRNA pseudouridine55 synthase
LLGILLIDKPAGITSHDVVNDVRRRLGTRRVGHAGTLDPTATGLLVVAVGPATRFLQYLPLEPKEYVGDVTFGIETTTQDSEGEIVSQQDAPPALEQRLVALLPQFHGLIQQLPPMYSAVKKAGKPLYAYARKGQEVARNPRTIHIESITVEEVAGPVVRLRVVCSGGTYMRTLAHDLGQALGCGAYLSSLRRDRVGRFNLDEAISLDQVELGRLIPLREALPPVPLVSLTLQDSNNIREGRAVRLSKTLEGPLAGLLNTEGAVIGMARVEGNLLQPECVIPIEAAHGTP